MNFTKLAATCIALGCSLLSGILSFQFMASITMMLGLMAICLEAAKSLLPHLAHTAWQSKQYVKSAALSMVLAVLVALSFVASVYSVSEAANISHKQSDQYSALTVQINQAQDSVARLTKINHITKANQIAETIPSLIEQRSKLQGDSLLDQHGQEIAVIVAAAIELVSLALAVTLFSDKTSEDNSRSPKFDQDVKTAQSPVLAQDSGIRLVYPAHEAKTVTIEAKMNVEDEIKQAVKRGAFESVTVSSVAKAFPINRNRINKVLGELVTEGVLNQQGNRRVLAA